jgi:uncharacterized protein YceK
MRPVLAALLTLAVSLQFGCKSVAEKEAERKQREHDMAVTTLAGLCDAYTEAAKKSSDPEVAYKDVEDRFIAIWPPLIKMRAGVQGIDLRTRYPLWLRFARRDYQVANWSCPALDQMLLQMIDRQPKLENPPPSKYHHQIVRVALSGDVSVDGKVVPLASLRETVGKIQDQDPPVFMDLYREGWATKMHPNADVAVSALTDARFTFAVCTQPACPEYKPR